MPEFQFTARDSKGNSVAGKRNASSPEDLASQLQNEALIPVEITKASKKTTLSPVPSSKKKFFYRNPRVSKDELQIFCRQMYTVLKSGIPIGFAVARIAETTRDKNLVHAMQQVLVSLNQGKSLHVALMQFPNIFSDFFINLVKVGENTGQLDTVFLHLAQYLELETDTAKKVKTAMRYPTMVIIVTLLSIIVISTIVIPAFSDMFKSFNAELPLPTRILFAISNFLLNEWYILLIAFCLLFYLVRQYLKTPTGALTWAKMQLKIPIIGWLLHRIVLTRFARLYALCLRSGLSAVEAIELVGSSTGNVFMSSKIKQVAGLVTRGNSIANSITQTQLFPPLVVQMITLGEETGRIDALLDDVADFYQREIEYELLRLSDAIQPIMMVIVGIMVLILALGVYLPMWQLAGQAIR